MSIDEIEQLMKDGKIAEADAAAKELSEREPNNLQAKMLYGTCRQLLGDEETFRRIHDELAPVMDQIGRPGDGGDFVWKKYHALWMSLIVGGLVLAGIVILKNQWTMADVLVKFGSLTDGVECLFDGERVKDAFKVKPGRYELLFKRNGYEPQVVEFVANISEGCTVEAPSKWEPSPVEVSCQELEDGVRCFLGRSEVVKTVRLTPGRSYEFRYQKDDCVDQSVKMFVEAGTTAVVPAPSFWVDTQDVDRLSEAERFFDDGKLDEAERSLDGINLKTAANVRRLQQLKEKIKAVKADLREKQERESAIRVFLKNVELAYRPEYLMGGDARVCIQCYYDAVGHGYILNTEDRERIEHCYDVGLRDLKDQRIEAVREIRGNLRPFRTPDELDKDTKQLREMYNALRK